MTFFLKTKDTPPAKCDDLLLPLKGLCLFCLGFLPACSTPAVKVDPTVLHSSYDYAKPAEIADKSKPVWILPVINKGWVPATVDPKTGDWISGHYTASIIQDGHWATLEEAELAGRPYVVAGQSKPVVPIPAANANEPQEVPPSGIVGGEIDLTELNRRVSDLEQKQTPPDPHPDPTRALPATKFANPSGEPISLLDDPSASVPQNRLLAPSPDRPAELTAPTPSRLAVVLPGKTNNNNFEIPLRSTTTGQTEKIQVHYLNEHQVEILYHGKTYEVPLVNPDDQIKLIFP